MKQVGDFFHTADVASADSSVDDLEISSQLSELKPVDSNSLVNEKPSRLVLILTAMSSISGLMFGYDTGYISSALVSIGESFGKPLSYGDEQFITAATSLGALIFAFSSGLIVDYLGRKPVLMLSNVMFVLGAIIQCAAESVWTMVAGRFVMGFGVGIGSLIAPLYISELAPSRFRGRLVVINCLGITGGQLVAYAIGAGLNKVHNGWRILVGLSMVPAVVQFVGFIFLPETPRFMVMANKPERAMEILKRTHPNASEESIKAKVRQLQNDDSEIQGNPLQKWWIAVKELHTVPSNFRALFLSCALQMIQQLTGFNSLMYFSSTIFKSVGFDDSTSVSIVVAATNFVFTVIAFFLIDKMGRRKMLLLSLPCVMGFLVLNAIAFHFIDIEFKGNDAIVHGNHHTWGIVIIVAMICFVASYAVGIGNVPWQQSEMFPQRVRGVGLSYACASNWSGSLVISSTFLTMLKNITPTGTFSLFTGFCLLAFVLIYFTYPELSNLELEEVQDILTGGFHIKTSIQLAKMRKRQRGQIKMLNSDDTEESV